MLIGSDGEELTWWGCQTALAEQCCSALSSLRCAKPEFFAIFLCLLHTESLCGVEEGSSVPAVTTAIRAGREDCFILPLGNLSQRWLCCVQGHAKLDITALAVAVIGTKCCPKGCRLKTLLDAEQWHENQLILFSSSMQFVTLHNGFLSFPPISTFYLIPCTTHVRRSTSEMVTDCEHKQLINH